MSKVTIINHPLIQHKLSIVRNKDTASKEFRALISEIGSLMTYEATRDLELKSVQIETPIAACECSELKNSIVICPVLRAGLGMAEGIHNMIPQAKVGHIGLYRDEETLQTQQYYSKLPVGIENAVVVLVDPMLATGNTAVYAASLLKKANAKKIIYVGLVGVQEGIDQLQQAHPDVDIYLAAKDAVLNEHGYIIPGLGDCGDRLFGTK
ncbi:MAG: uracil phosphoribosyltransferase [Bacilli bacterium]|nr:uracil phosphoribosyltransferase [Bacilli bacterium]